MVFCIIFNITSAGISVTLNLQNELACSSLHNRKEHLFSLYRTDSGPSGNWIFFCSTQNCRTDNNTVINLPAHLGNVFLKDFLPILFY